MRNGRPELFPRPLASILLKRISVVRSLLPLLALALLAGCEGSSGSNDSEAAPAPPLAADSLNLIFVTSPDLAYPGPGDVDPDTSNLTDQGLQRALRMATYLKAQVLGARNVTRIYALTPMTHLQTTPKHADVPDMTALGYIEQFALLNQVTLPVDASGTTYTAYSYPLKVAYAPGSVPEGVAVPAASYCPDCSGLDFRNTEGNNDALVSGIVGGGAPGYYVFSAPWETIGALMAATDRLHDYHLDLPTSYGGPDRVYAISIAPSRGARLVKYDAALDPPPTYPVPPSPVASAACNHALQPYLSVVRTGGVDGVVVPDGISKNQTVHIVRHAEAHPDASNKFEDGNIVGAGQWRALGLAAALRGKINPDVVYSVDPAQWYSAGHSNVSYVRPSLTVLPYAVANRLPYYLVSNFEIVYSNQAQLAKDFFFTGGKFSNQTVLLGWESARIKPLINALPQSYGGSDVPLLPTVWPSLDYDTIWTVTLDRQGNLSVDNGLCEGIDSAALPSTAPPF